MKPSLFCGSGCAIVTPMLPDGSIHLEALGKLIDYQLDNETDAIIVCGTTGEAATLSDKEQQQLIEYTVKKVNHRVPVIAGAGSNNTAHAVELCKNAKKVRPIGTHQKSVSSDCCYTIIYPFNGYRKKKKTLFAKVFSHERNQNMSLCSVFIIPPFCANVNNLWNIYSETKKVPKHLFWIIHSQDTDGLYAEGKISSSP